MAVNGAVPNSVRAVVAVDAGRIRLDDREHVATEVALRANRVELVREVCLCLGARGEALPGERELEGIETRYVEGREACRPAYPLQKDAAIGSRHPAGAVRDVGLGLSRHVRHAEGVAHDGDTRARPLTPAPSVRAETERRRFEVAAKVLRRHVPGEWSQSVVELRLVSRVPIEGQGSGLAWSQDRPGGRGVVAARARRLARRDGERARCDDSHRDRR